MRTCGSKVLGGSMESTMGNVIGMVAMRADQGGEQESWLRLPRAG